MIDGGFSTKALLWDTRKHLFNPLEYGDGTFIVAICHMSEKYCFFSLGEGATYKNGNLVPKELVLRFDPDRIVPHNTMMRSQNLWDDSKPRWKQDKNFRGGGFTLKYDSHDNVILRLKYRSGQLNANFNGDSKEMNVNEKSIFKDIVHDRIVEYFSYAKCASFFIKK